MADAISAKFKIAKKPQVSDYPFLNPTSFTFKCVYEECHKTFKLTNDLYEHIRNEHTTDIKCPTCNREFACMATLCYHARRHTNEKPYVCPLPTCEFQSATKGNLKAHLLSNTHHGKMTLKLLNVILAMDTRHPRPEKRLHRPRETRKNYLEPKNKNSATAPTTVNHHVSQRKRAFSATIPNYQPQFNPQMRMYGAPNPKRRRTSFDTSALYQVQPRHAQYSKWHSPYHQRQIPMIPQAILQRNVIAQNALINRQSFIRQNLQKQSKSAQVSIQNKNQLTAQDLEVVLTKSKSLSITKSESATTDDTATDHSQGLKFLPAANMDEFMKELDKFNNRASKDELSKSQSTDTELNLCMQVFDICSLNASKKNSSNF